MNSYWNKIKFRASKYTIVNVDISFWCDVRYACVPTMVLTSMKLFEGIHYIGVCCVQFVQ